MPEYTARDLEEFGRWLEQFKEEKKVTVHVSTAGGLLGEPLGALRSEFKLSSQETIYPINMPEAMVAFGAMRKRERNGRVYYSVLVTATRPYPYDLFWHKYEAFEKRNARKQYAEEKELEELERTAAQVMEEHTVSEVEF